MGPNVQGDVASISLLDMEGDLSNDGSYDSVQLL